MRKTIAVFAACLALGFIIGCMSRSRATYNTLASVQIATTGAYNGYLDAVVLGLVPTNSVPIVSRDYNMFQQFWSAAVFIAQWDTNSSPVPQSVLDSSAQVITDINLAKGAK